LYARVVVVVQPVAAACLAMGATIAGLLQAWLLLGGGCALCKWLVLDVAVVALRTAVAHASCCHQQRVLARLHRHRHRRDDGDDDDDDDDHLGGDEGGRQKEEENEGGEEEEEQEGP
jgi:hypothetical protein